MAVPDFQSLTLPVLREFADGHEHATKNVRQRVATQLGLTAVDVALANEQDLHGCIIDGVGSF